MAEPLIYETEGPRATITLARPDKHNLLEVGDLPLFARLLARADADPGLRVLVVTGKGRESFCSGIAIGDIAATDWRDNPLERLTARLEAVRLPVIAALNGGVYGGGADLALACDFRVGVEGMRLAIPPAKLGIAYHVAGYRRVVERVGLGPAKRLFLAAETLEAEELLRIGYLDELVAPDALAAATARRARALAELAPLSVRNMKRILNRIARGTLDEADALDAIMACFDSRDAEEGLAAFAEKRKPRFRGR